MNQHGLAAPARKAAIFVFASSIALLFPAGLAGGCRRDSSHAGADGERDYRALMERSRNKREASANQRRMEEAIRDFHIQLGRFPTNLNEVARVGFIESVPPPPPGSVYSYNPVSGTFQIVPAGAVPHPPGAR